MDSRESGSTEECPEEKRTQSAYSPGTVRDGEALARFIYRDDHIGDDGLLAPAALPVKDLLEPDRRGLSVARSQHMTMEELGARAGKLQSGTQVARYGAAQAGAVRETTADDTSRAFCVVDAGERDFPAHALIRLDNPKVWTPSSVRRLRRALLRIFTLVDLPMSV